MRLAFNVLLLALCVAAALLCLLASPIDTIRADSRRIAGSLWADGDAIASLAIQHQQTLALLIVSGMALALAMRPTTNRRRNHRIAQHSQFTSIDLATPNTTSSRVASQYSDSQSSSPSASSSSECHASQIATPREREDRSAKLGDAVGCGPSMPARPSLAALGCLLANLDKLLLGAALHRRSDGSGVRPRLRCNGR